MELRYLRYFVAVAELKNFTRAAEKLRVAQPAISQQIKTLEDELGVPLLLRTKRSVSVTPAGRAFLAEARAILERVETAKLGAQRSSRGETGTLSIGCFSSAAAHFLPELIQAYREKFPDVRVHIHELTPQQQIEALAAGRIDLAFTRATKDAAPGRFVEERVYRDRPVAVLPERHPLAGSRWINLGKLAGEDWVFFRRGEGAELVDALVALCTEAGFSPRIVSDPPAMLPVVMMVAAGVGVSLAPSCVSSFGQPGVKFIPLRPAPPGIDLVVARRAGDAEPTAAEFLRLLREWLPVIRGRYEDRVLP